MRENCRQAWVQALNKQACRPGSSIRINFGENLPFPASASIDCITYADQSAHSMVLHCNCTVETVTFPVTVTQQSPATVSVDTFQVTIAPVQAQMVVHLEDMDKEGLLASWTFSQQPLLHLTVLPCQVQQEVDTEFDLNVVGELVKSTIINSQPAVVLCLRTGDPELTSQEENSHHGDLNPSLPVLSGVPESHCHSSLKMDVVERQPTGNSVGYPVDTSPIQTLDSEVSDRQDSKVGAAVQPMVESSEKAAKGTPPKRVTLKALIDEDGSTSLAGGLTAMDTGHESGMMREVAHSNNGERPSVYDPGWELGSTGALETHSLKDQKGGFLRSSTRLLLRKKSRQKDPSLSRSHEDVADSSSGCSPRRRSSSFSRRLIKRFSLRSRSGGKSNLGGGLG
ncbi:phospholipid transfer protein C2CD2L-like isoform X2 [Brienomyrus brachyistius]|nr:phospholipid transfer protein C2CD2L-like isoform X2 [Brienomyrus brachyistius]XP_048838113.1 phospholipid transfer protein C2CD2L-like isoform X2 [Brienomyrus brachyistius]XP_048838114.1 phospholipid transfer protein C2CD2L-like isoform X2 [Brienomyrus brachyistius]